MIFSLIRNQAIEVNNNIKIFADISYFRKPEIIHIII